MKELELTETQQQFVAEMQRHLLGAPLQQDPSLQTGPILRKDSEKARCLARAIVDKLGTTERIRQECQKYAALGDRYWGFYLIAKTDIDTWSHKLIHHHIKMILQQKGFLCKELAVEIHCGDKVYHFRKLAIVWATQCSVAVPSL